MTLGMSLYFCAPLCSGLTDGHDDSPCLPGWVCEQTAAPPVHPQRARVSSLPSQGSWLSQGSRSGAAPRVGADRGQQRGHEWPGEGPCEQVGLRG